MLYLDRLTYDGEGVGIGGGGGGNEVIRLEIDKNVNIG